MKALTVLKKARRLISDPSKWTKGCYAKNELYEMCDPDSSEAVSYCSMGAIRKYTANASELYKLLQYYTPEGYISVYNDHTKTTHNAVLTMYDWAIGTLEAGVKL